MRRTTILAVTSLATLLGGCFPNPLADDYQRVQVAFDLDEELPPDEDTLVHAAGFVRPVSVAKQFVGLSGQLVPPLGGALPDRITVLGTVEAEGDGGTAQKIKVKVNVDDDGTFSAKGKIKKNLAAGDLLSVTVNPQGEAIAAGTRVVLCVDVVPDKADLDALPPCAGIVGSGGGGATPRLADLQQEIFSGTCALAGCHDASSASADLVLAAGSTHGNLVNVPSTEAPPLLRVAPGDPDGSYLIKKLRGDADIVGARMPLSSPPLDQDQIEAIAAWIEAGARND